MQGERKIKGLGMALSTCSAINRHRVEETFELAISLAAYKSFGSEFSKGKQNECRLI